MALGPILTSVLQRYDLMALAPWASQKITDNASPEEIELAIYDHPVFRERFWMIFERQAKNKPPMSPDEVLAYEERAVQMYNAYGIPNVTRRELGELMVADVSIDELDTRLGMASTAVYQSDRVMREELNRLYGITTGDLTRYWLDPKQELPALQRRFVTGQISGEAKRAGFGTDLNVSQLEYLYGRGMTGEAATAAFGTLVESEELFEAVDETEQDIDVNEQLQLITGDVDVAQKVERRAQRRLAPFQGGGGFATGETGVAGLGTAST
jgi:hypothetical protein